VNSWLCPTCLRVIPRNQSKEITAAHIVPRAAGGGLITVLCRSCNSKFGTNQDKWLGEFLCLLGSNQPFPFSTTIRSHSFEIDGVRVGGIYDIQPDSGVRFIIDARRTNPATLRAFLRSRLLAVLIRRASQQRLEKHTASVPIPILQHKELIAIGFLTAAYLLWFKELGYSWALQGHLDNIRKQLCNPTRQILSPKFLAVCKERVFEPPWIGIGEVAGKLALIAAVGNHIVFLPPADRPNFYEALPDDFDGLGFDLPRPLQFYKGHQFEGPVGILFGTRAVMVPDILRMDAVQGRFIYYPSGHEAPQILYPIPDEQYEQALKSPNVVHVNLLLGQ
jgi:hypothetical protein